MSTIAVLCAAKLLGGEAAQRRGAEDRSCLGLDALDALTAVHARIVSSCLAVVPESGRGLMMVEGKERRRILKKGVDKKGRECQLAGDDEMKPTLFSCLDP